MKPQLKAVSAAVLRTIGGLAIGLLIAGAALPAPLASQTITIRLLEGKTGRALSDKNVTLLWSPDYFPPGSVIYFGKDGIGTVNVPTGSEFFMMQGGPRIGKEPYRIPFINCNASMSEMIRVSEVLKKRLCSRKHMQQKDCCSSTRRNRVLGDTDSVVAA